MTTVALQRVFEPDGSVKRREAPTIWVISPEHAMVGGREVRRVRIAHDDLPSHPAARRRERKRKTNRRGKHRRK